MQKLVIVAIDGPAGAGKSTVARLVAERLGFVYIDTGAMYRAVALWAMRRQIGLDDMHRLEQLAAQADIRFEPGQRTVLLNGEDVTEAIRAPGVSEAASRVSAVPGVRRALVAQQRKIGAEAPVVMEGRDIGTVVFPEAQMKVFLDARPEVRAERRSKELQEKGERVVVEDLAREIRERDHRDASRADSPLMQAPDAVYLDTTLLSIDEVVAEVLKLVRNRTSNGKDPAR